MPCMDEDGCINILFGIFVATFLATWGHDCYKRRSGFNIDTTFENRTYSFADGETRSRFSKVVRPYMDEYRASIDPRPISDEEIRQEQKALENIAKLADDPRYCSNGVLDAQEIAWTERNREKIQAVYNEGMK